MKKGVIILLAVIILSFLIGFLFLKENSPIVSLACKPIVSVGCRIDSCGTCVNKDKEDATVAYRTGSLDTYIGCDMGLVDVRGAMCKKSNDSCQFRKTWRTTACQSLSELHSKIRINLGIEY